jgi:transcriptional regulator with GAF, ATPase, and Fis domain
LGQFDGHSVAARAELLPSSARTLWDSGIRYKLLLDVNNAIINQTTREELFHTLAREIRKIVAYDRFSINIYDSASKLLRWFASAEGVSVKSMDDSPRSLEEGPVARAVITSRQPVIIPDMSAYSHWHTIRLMKAAGLGATMAFPLIVRSNVLGSLHFSFREAPENLEELKEFLVELSGQVAVAVDNMMAHTKLVEVNASLQQQKDYLLKHADTRYRPADFFYCSPAMRKIMREIEVIADSDASVLLTGETGTGKDYIARYIHHLSSRRNALFVKVNCPSLAATLFESELFGHNKGAFTGADAKRVGRFEMAAGGTVFLDEIAELPPQLQAKLLHVLQDRRFERVGDSHPIEADFRVIAATNSDLKKAISEKNFRTDLLYRLNAISFHIPPLRERSEEIEPLVHRLTEAEARSTHRVPPVITAEAIAALKQHSWPGNVRELRNVMSRLVIVYSGKQVTRHDIEPLLDIGQVEVQQTATALADMERNHLIKVLTMSRGVVGGRKGAAAVLNVPKSTLQYKLHKHGLNPQDYR